MASKKIVAAMRIKHNGEVIDVDDVIDPTKFTEDELTRLYQRGAVKIVLSDAPKEPTEEDLEDAKALANKASEEKAKADAEKQAADKAKTEAAKPAVAPVKPANGTTK